MQFGVPNKVALDVFYKSGSLGHLSLRLVLEAMIFLKKKAFLNAC